MINTVQIPIELTQCQKIINNCKAKYIFVQAGRKFGKTEYAKWDILKNCSGDGNDGKGDEVVYVAPFRQQAKDIFWRRIKKTIPPESMKDDPGESELSIDLLNDIRISLRGADNEDACRGPNWRRAVLEEAAFMREGFDEEIIEPNLAKSEGGILYISSPKGVNWFSKKRRKAQNGELGPDYAGFKFTIYDNPHISREWIEKRKQSVTRETWEQEYMANESAYAGCKYHEFDARRHVISHQNPRDGQLLARGIDWGWDHPSVCLWGEIFWAESVKRWRIYIYHEFEMRNSTVSVFCNKVKSISGNSSFVYTPICYSSRKHEVIAGKTIISEFSHCGVQCSLPPSDDSYRENALKMMLLQDDILISNRCTMLRKQLENVEWGTDVGDDYTDALKYLASYTYKRDMLAYQIAKKTGQPIPNNPLDGPIDPLGILAGVSDSDTIVWDKETGYIG